MTQRTIGPASGKLVDIAADPLGYVLVWQDGITGQFVLAQVDRDGNDRVPNYTDFIGTDNGFPVVHVWNRETWVAYRAGAGNVGVIRNITTGQRWGLGPVHGNCPIAISNGHVAWQSDASYTVQRIALDALRPLLFTEALKGTLTDTTIGRGTGLAYAMPLVSVDQARIVPSLPGMANAREAWGIAVGENTTGIDRNIVRHKASGDELTLWPNLVSFTPRIASADGSSFAVATSGGPGVRLATFTRTDLVPPVVVVPPPVLPDIPWKTDPTGVIEDVAEWLFSRDQGPDIHISPDGNVRFFCKSDEVSGDGPDPHIGEHWDRSDDPTDFNIGHLDDASTGRRVLNGKAVTPEDLVKTGQRVLWPTLKLSHNWFKNDKRLWMPRRLVSGTVIKYVTDILWNSTTPETPNSTVWKSIPIEIRVDVGYGRYRGKEVRARVSYIPDGNGETNFYGKPEGYNAWVIAAGNSDPWAGH